MFFNHPLSSGSFSLASFFYVLRRAHVPIVAPAAEVEYYWIYITLDVIELVNERYRFGQAPQRDLRFADGLGSRTTPTRFEGSIVVPTMVVLRLWQVFHISERIGLPHIVSQTRQPAQ